VKGLVNKSEGRTYTSITPDQAFCGGSPKNVNAIAIAVFALFWH